MDALDHTLIWAWCRENGVPLAGEDADPPTRIVLTEDPARGCATRRASVRAGSPQSRLRPSAHSAHGTSAWSGSLTGASGPREKIGPGSTHGVEHRGSVAR